MIKAHDDPGHLIPYQDGILYIKWQIARTYDYLEFGYIQYN